MGKKQTGKGKHIFLHFTSAGVLVFVILGCLHYTDKLKGQQLLEKGMGQMASHEYEASMDTTLAVLNQFPRILADRAFFQIGLLYAQPLNSNYNLGKSLESFKVILDGYPESPLIPEAQLWIFFIRDVIEKEQEIALLSRRTTIQGENIEQQKLELSLLKKKHEEQKQEIIQLLDQIEKFKRVDLGIAEKKQKIKQQNDDVEEIKNGKNSGS